ncbi:MAG: hypothetical protein WB760_33200 [Xanthobacteraceae bacterium]
MLVLSNGARYAEAGRAYFAAFHEGNLPPGWLAYDNVGGYQISLGSWHDQLPALYVVCNAANGKCPAVGTVPLPQPSSSDSWSNSGMKRPLFLAVAFFLIYLASVVTKPQIAKFIASMENCIAHLMIVINARAQGWGKGDAVACSVRASRGTLLRQLSGLCRRLSLVAWL